MVVVMVAAVKDILLPLLWVSQMRGRREEALTLQVRLGHCCCLEDHWSRCRRHWHLCRSLSVSYGLLPHQWLCQRLCLCLGLGLGLLLRLPLPLVWPTAGRERIQLPSSAHPSAGHSHHVAGHGKAWQGVAGRGMTWHSMAQRDMAGHGTDRTVCRRARYETPCLPLTLCSVLLTLFASHTVLCAAHLVCLSHCALCCSPCLPLTLCSLLLTLFASAFSDTR